MTSPLNSVPANSVPGSERTEIFTEGACQGNSGRGGWAVVLYEGGQRRVISGNDRRTTANRMELTAVIQGMEAAPKGLPLVVNSENRYLVEIVKRGRERTANVDLWERVDRLRAELDVSWWWVRTRRGNPGSEIAGRVANMEAGLFETWAVPRRRFSRAPSSSSQRQGRPAVSQRSGTQQSGQKPDADRQSGSQPSGNQPSRPPQSGDQPSRPSQSGQRPNVTQPGGSQPSGNQPSRRSQSGQRPNPTRPGGSQPSGNQPSRPPQGGQRPNATRPGGNQPSGDQRSRPPQGGQRPNPTRPGGSQPSGNQPSGNQRSRPSQSGQRPNATRPSGSRRAPPSARRPRRSP